MLLLLSVVLLALVGVPVYALLGMAALILFLDLPEGSWEAPAVAALGGKLAENTALVTLPFVAFAGCVLAMAKAPRGKLELATPLVLIGGVGLGVLRLHEAAALSALYVLVIEALVYRKLSLTRELPRAVVDAMTLVGVLVMIAVTAIGLDAFRVQAW